MNLLQMFRIAASETLTQILRASPRSHTDCACRGHRLRPLIRTGRRWSYSDERRDNTGPHCTRRLREGADCIVLQLGWID